MKKLMIINLMVMAALLSASVTAQDITNDFYDDAETYHLTGNKIIEVAGEISNPGFVDISTLELRSLVIKEALLHEDANRFIGAYRYDGYSLYDILNLFILKKKNEVEFPPIIDMYVTIENDKGEYIVLSWGEIYYPVQRHAVIIATQVARIVPSRTKDLWPLPQETKLIIGHDLITERNISNPVKITIHSADKSFHVDRQLKPLFSPLLSIYRNGTKTGEVSRPVNHLQQQTYETIFYGRGRGIHSTTPFKGIMLKDLLDEYFIPSADMLRHGYFIIASVDGYRSVFTFGEIFNRNDQSEVLMVMDWENQDGGAFRLFPSADFFSDRAVKAVSEIWLVDDHLLNSNFSPR